MASINDKVDGERDIVVRFVFLQSYTHKLSAMKQTHGTQALVLTFMVLNFVVFNGSAAWALLQRRRWWRNGEEGINMVQRCQESISVAFEG